MVCFILINSIRIFCKQIEEALIRRPILRYLIWVCTVCLCPQKGCYANIGLDELNKGDIQYMEKVLKYVLGAQENNLNLLSTQTVYLPQV